MPRNDRSVYAEPSRSERISVYRNNYCKAIFSGLKYGRLRQRKAIASVVRERGLRVPGFSTERLITVIRSLQKDRIFEDFFSARRAFSELFQEPTSQAPASTPPAATDPSRPAMVSADRPQKDLFGSLESLYKTGNYSDLTISSVAKSYSVHRAIVCPRSDFLAAACRSPFTESSDDSIHLPDDEPCVFDMMMQYFYLLDYRQSLYIDSLLQSPELEQRKPESITCLLLHAKVYTIAEKYAVDGLKDLAVAKFKVAAAQAWDPNDFLHAATEAYTSTIDTDRGFRDVVLEAFAVHDDLLDDDEAKTTIKSLGSLPYDLLLYLHREGKFQYDFEDRAMAAV
ncbi:BTB/POZ domain-containing protein [Colletotrichum fioriniae PJ7]|uniref:BTB/POZ domain-containing protein n=1 Tax=Colletotrichum fioriniae PJ7 TaxID=1445577 RepID=A0A010QWN7_9PEZI|nr:BTB/POZ domain-containing protein [Colletotrichum fioriniae PJ7]